MDVVEDCYGSSLQGPSPHHPQLLPEIAQLLEPFLHILGCSNKVDVVEIFYMEGKCQNTWLTSKEEGSKVRTCQ